MSKDTIKVNMNVYDIPILVEQLKKLEQENQQLKERIDKAIEYINENWGHWCSNHCKYATETIEILEGKK